jgi:hypothetical protein
MNKIHFPLEKGYVHNWLVAGPQEIRVEELHRFNGPDYKLQIARHYHQTEPGLQGEAVEYGKCQWENFDGRWQYVRNLHDHLVDLSVFHHITHYLRAWAYTEINSPSVQMVSMILTTNGPADLWINSQHVHRQEHFYHQTPNRVRLQVQLNEGVNQILIRFEEVAARECPYAMALQILDFVAAEGAEDKVVGIPIGKLDALRRLKLELLFEACHIRKDVYARNDGITVYLPEGPAAMTDFNIRLQDMAGFIYADMFRQRNMDTHHVISHPYQIPDGSYQLLFMPTPREYYEENVRVTRKRDLYATSNIYSTQPYGDYASRCKEALLDAAKRTDNVFSEIAKMELGLWNKIDERVVLKTIDGINQRGDCSDFYLCGLLGVLYRYASKEEFPASLRQPLEDCVLNFKYWNDEPGSDAMCYTTENHSILFHTCEILAGQLYPERIFSNVNQPGKWHIEKGERLALAWLQNRAKYGFKEWDSNTYFEEDTLALATLTSLADNAEVWEFASLMLDKMYFTMAVNSFKGVFGSTHGRSYTPFIKTGYRECTSGISRLLWGMGIFNDRILGTVSLACSSYELPSILASIAADQPDALWSKEHIRGDEEDFRNSGSAGTGVNKVTYKTPDYMLCSAQDWHPGELGYQQHIWQATLSPEVGVFTTHPPCAAEDNSHRPNYWHGNATLPRVAQWKDALIAVYNLPADDWMGFTHAYFPAGSMEAFEIKEHWAFGKVGDGYIAVGAAHPLEFMMRGDNAFRDLRSAGTPNIWLCQMGRAALDGSFADFIEKVLALPVRFEGAQVEWTTLRGEPIRFGWEGPLTVNGEIQPLDGFRHYDNSYCTCEFDAPVMEINHGGETLRLLFDASEEETR